MVIIFVCSVDCIAYDELFGLGSGMHLDICPARLALDCCAWAPV